MNYRLYFLDASDEIKRREDIDLPDDQAARDKAYELDHAYAIEIWEGKRIVGRVFPDAAFGVDPGRSTLAPRAD